MGKRKTHEEFIKEIQDKYNGKYTILGKYEKSSIKILVRHNCKSCNNHEWMITPNNLLYSYGCPICSGNIKKTTEEFKEEIKEKYGNKYSVLGHYVSCKTKILIRHNCVECNNYEWEAYPNNLLRGHGCPKCEKNAKKTTKEFKKEIKIDMEMNILFLDNTKMQILKY